MTEDAGERAHQTETNNERRLQCMINREQKEIAKARYEFMQKKPMVAVIQAKLFQKTKRKFKDKERETAEDRQEEAQRARQDCRDTLLSLAMYEGSMETLVKGLKVDTVGLLGYTPIVWGSIVFQDSKPKSPEVIVIVDDDEHQETIDLLWDDAHYLKHLTTSVQLETEAGMMIEKHSEEVAF